MGLIGGIARTAIASGTWTAVSNRVSRRQSDRWAQQDQQAYQQQAYQQQAYQQQAYQQAAPAQAAPAVSSPVDDRIARLKELGELKANGVLTEEEFAAEKARILGA